MLGKLNILRGTWSLPALAGNAAIVAVAATIGVANVVSGTGAALNATSFNAAPHSITTGTLILDAPTYPSSGTTPSAAGFTTAVTGLVPGDVIHRFVSYTNSGTETGTALSLWATAAASNILTSDATRGLQLSVTNCSAPWTWTAVTSTATCSGTTTVGFAITAVSALLTETNKKAFTGFSTLAPGTMNLKFDISLPSGTTERRANGAAATANDGSALSGGSIQNLNAAITWTIYAEQGAAEDTNA